MIPNPVENLFSRVVDVAEELKTSLHLAIEADEPERSVLAARFGLASLDALTASAVLQRSGSAVTLHVDWRADLVQSCVVTLAPVKAHLVADFDLLYMPEEQAEAGTPANEGRRDIRLSLDDPDPPEPLIDGRIDVGEALAEHFGLALDPYPRAPGAEWPASAEPGEREAARTPFAVLASLRAKG